MRHRQNYGRRWTCLHLKRLSLCFHTSFLFNPEHNLLAVDGEHTLTVDELMEHYVRACDGGSICLVCGKRLRASKRGVLASNMRRHMREIHLSSDEDYYCPPCAKYFKNKSSMRDHIRRKHSDWKGVDYDSFAVKS